MCRLAAGHRQLAADHSRPNAAPYVTVQTSGHNRAAMQLGNR